MPQLLWISPFSLHDRALAPARQLLQMVRALKMMQPQLQISVLCPTIFSSTDPHAIDLSVRQEVLQIQGNTIILDHGVQFLYMKTHSTDFGAMATIEQRNFVNELVPLFHSLKPDVVVVHNCDLLSLCALNQAKLCGLSTAFILHDFIPSYFHFADVDLILSTSQVLTQAFVLEGYPPTAEIGSFMPATGPLNQSALANKVKAAQAAREAASASTGALQGMDSTRHNINEKLMPIAQRRKIMLVNPSLENGLGLFLYVYAHRAEHPELSAAEFVVLEQEPDQFKKALKQYHTAAQSDAQATASAYADLDLSGLRVQAPYDDVENQLRHELRSCRVLVMPNLSATVTCYEHMQAISYGVKVITTEQPTLQEFLGNMATYIDVDQDVVDNLATPPSEKECQKWLQAVVDTLNAPIELEPFKDFFKDYSYEACMLRLSLSLKMLLDRSASNNPQLLRKCVFSLRRAIEQQANSAALQAVAQGLSPQSGAKSE